MNPEQPHLENQAGPSGEVLMFDCAGSRFLVRLDTLDEVLMPALLRRIPQAPAHLLGVLNLRGLMLPIVDLAERLALAAPGRSQWHLASRILRVSSNGLNFGVVVDAVSGIHHLDPAGYRPSAAAASADCLGDLWLVHGRLVQEVRLERLVDAAELVQLKGAEAGMGT